MQVAATNYAKGKVLGKVGDHLHKNQRNYETDQEIIAATQEAAAKQTHHWWKKDKVFTPDMLLSKHDRKILLKVKNRAWYLDQGFHCCCFNVGLDGLVGLIPGIGDVIGTAFSVELIRTAAKANLPKELLAKMMVNVLFDFMIGLTPVAGDILDILFKCNMRNAALLEEYLILRRRDEIRLEKGEPAAHALMDGPRHGDTSTSSTTPVPTHVVNHTDPPTITELDAEGQPVKDDDKKKYGTFFGKWKS
ncbi:uncharacterized protein EV154DRAFT_527650 [Mucor mucedo]|uniref:uncharacterized protein n=1 Tax=Mucor mucedo TaxID=29922 RepID=UPI00221E77FB|nr:uncharacterized protein EV154DRAFT_527650 [Mucor mucedo]KAI7873851.1 hypothetical protein EV154DRAFT_527650 [Mucor mucedo]